MQISSKLHLDLYRGRAEEYIRRSKAAQTLKAYRADWNDFAGFCEREGRVSLPATPETIAYYLTWLIDIQKRKVTTLNRRLSSIAQLHLAAGFPSATGDPAVKALMAGIRRSHGTAQTRKKALQTATLILLLNQIPKRSPRNLRDRALLLVGFAGGFRRSELVALQMSDMEAAPEGLLVRIRRSKGDQEGAGETIGIPFGRNKATCPVTAFEEWVAAAGICDGFVFRSTAPWTGAILERGLEPKRVATLIQKLAAKAGLDPKQFGGHSLRSGLATTAASSGASERSIMKQTRHKSVQQVRRYIQEGSVFQDNAGSFLGL